MFYFVFIISLYFYIESSPELLQGSDEYFSAKSSFINYNFHRQLVFPSKLCVALEIIKFVYAFNNFRPLQSQMGVYMRSQRTSDVRRTVI